MTTSQPRRQRLTHHRCYAVLLLLVVAALTQLVVSGAHADDASVSTSDSATALSLSAHTTLFRTTANELFAVYQDGGHIYYRKSTDNGTTWSAATSIKFVDAFTDYAVSGYIDTANNIYLAYTPTRGNSYVYLVKLTYSSGTYTIGTEETVESSGTTQNYPSVAKDPGGTIWVSYEYYDGTHYSIVIKHSTDDGATWSALQVLSDGTQTTSKNYSAVSIYNNQHPIVVYQIDETSGGQAVFSRAYNGTTWSAEQTVDSHNDAAFASAFSTVTVGNDVFYVGGRPQFGTLRYATFDGTTWSSATIVNTSSNDTFDPQLTTDGTNVWLLYAHWSGAGTTYDIYYKKYDGSTWSSTGSGTALTQTGTNNRYPHVPQAVPVASAIPYVYESGTVSPYTIYSNSIRSPSSTTVTSSLNPSGSGQTVTLTATVTPSTATGTVTFKDGATTLGTAALGHGSGSYTTNGLSVGSHSMTAVYGGNSVYNASTSAVLTQVVKQVSTTSLASSLNPSTYGSGVTLTATVSPSTATGTITFKDGVTTLGTATLGHGSGSYATSSLSGGSHTLTAVYSGDSNNAGSTSSTLTQTVNKDNTSTILSTSLNPSTFGSGVTLTATVSPPTATGTITFKDGVTTLGTATLGHGSGSYATITLSAGSHSVTAVYGGNADYNTSTSAALTQTVNKANSSVSLTGSPNPASNSSPVTFSATVSPSSATGTLTFKDGATTLGTTTLGHGSGSYTTSSLALGSHSITAAYGGNVDFNTSTSTAVTETINGKASTTTTLTSALNPSTFGSGVTLTATISVSTATGSVTFKDGATTLGSATVSHGSGSFTTTTLSGGTHSLTAVYAGDANNNGSTSATLTQAVNKANSLTSITSSLNPSTFNNSITLTATDSPSTATGTITFKDGVTTLGTATLGHGSGAYTTSSLSVGSHSITAVYAGNSNYNGSTSAALTQTVNASLAPSAPTNLVATGVSDTEVNLTWDRTGTGETSITVWRATGTGAFAKLMTLPARSNIITDTSCYPSTSYTYKLTADNAHGSSPFSTAASAATLASSATLTPASNLAASATSPYSIHLSWTDNDTDSGRAWLIERSATGLSYSVIKELDSSSTSVTFDDTPLSPTTTYWYRTRLITGGAYSDYSPPVSTTTQSRPAGAPLEPLNLAATVNSATSTTLTWTDTNTGSTTYLVETTPFYFTTPTWTQIAETATGAASYALTTTAENVGYVRIRAKNDAGTSGYTPQIIYRSASAGTGSPKTYKIGPGQTYASLGALNWSQLGPGDTVLIYPNKDGSGNEVPYYEKPLISVRGTASAPITIEGVPDPVSGDLPIIDGSGATTSPQWQSHFVTLQDLSLILIGTRADNNNGGGWSPGYLTIEKLEIRNGYTGDNGTETYTAYDGSTRTYNETSGIYIEKGDNITIKGCVIHGNNEGIFAAGTGDARNLEHITIDSNQIYGNGTVSSSQDHNSYIEGIDTIYQFNHYGALRPSALGTGLKDRGAGTIIRYNDIDAGGHFIDLVETQNYQYTEITLPSYHKTYVYGNLIVNGTSDVVTLIHYGGDSLAPPSYRKGVLYFYNNTLITYDQYYVNPFDMSTAGESLDARNNILVDYPVQSPQFDLLSDAGVAYFGKNWVSIYWKVSRGLNPYTGHIAGTGSFINNPQNDPGFVSLTTPDLHLASGSQNIDEEDTLPADAPPVQYEYVATASGASRTVAGAAMDMGAFEYGTTSSTTLTSSLNPSTYGSGITLTATVSPSTATGTVAIKDGSTTLSTITLSHGSGSYATSSLSVGSHSLTAVYSGNGTLPTSTSPVVTQVVNGASTTTSLTSSLNPSSYGSGVTLKATVSPNTATGTLTFKDGSTTLGTATLSHGSGSYTTSALAVGSHSLTTVYGGNASFSGSTSAALTQTVNKTVTTTTLTSSLNPSTYGSGVTLTAIVSPFTATGTVTFKDGSATLTTITLSHGSGSYATSSLAAGSHSLTAVYGGNVDFSGSTSVALSQTVNKANTATIVSANINPSSAGQLVTFTAVVTPSTASGTITFKDGSTTLGTATLGHGSGAYATSGLSTGSHSITAAYAGNTDYLTSTSAAVTQTVSATLTPTTTTLTSSLNPSSYGSGVTLKATVSPNTATGTFIFKDGISVLSTVTVSHGSGSYALSSLSIGSHDLTAVYTDSGDYAGSTSTVVTQIVQGLPTSTTLTASTTSVTQGGSVRFTTTVSPSSATGTVAIKDGSTAITTITLSNGSGSYTTSSLAAGSHGITAVYSGAGNYAGSTSAAVTVTVSSNSASGGGGGEGGGGGGGGGGSRGLSIQPLSLTTETGSTTTAVGSSSSSPTLSLTVNNATISFRDVATTSWFAPFIAELVTKGIVTGYKDKLGHPLGLFIPSNPVTYAEVAKMVILGAGLTPSSATPQNHSARNQWSAGYIAEAESLQLAPYTLTVNVNHPMSRAEALEAVLQAFQIPLQPYKGVYKDVFASTRYADAIATATNLGIVQGDMDLSGKPTGAFRPSDPINRAEFSKILTEVMRLAH